MNDIEARLRDLKIELPKPAHPAANYVSAAISGSLLYLSGQGPRAADGSVLTGKVGAEISIDEAYARARSVGLGLLATVRDELGSLDRVRRIVKLLGMVNAVPEFTAHPAVVNGCSDLFVEVFGDAGRHARSAVGMASLPMNISVEIEAIFEIEPVGDPHT
jgi:enamine deaminase RidA (YjgF/YER057c/UK114 family)